MWHSCKEMLAQEIPAQQFATWIKPLKMRESDSALRIEVSNRFKLDWVRAQYLQRIVEVLEQMAGRAVPVELCIASRSKAGAAPVRRQLGASPEQPADALSASVAATPTKATAKAATKSSAKASAKITEKTAPKASATASSSTEAQLAPVSEADIPNYGIAVGMPAEQDPRSRARLDPRYTFDALVEGSANRMARAAAMHVATSPGELYNPLFIYGGVGLGKTHLLHAVGHLLLDRRPQAQVLYTHAEQFVTDVVTASRRGSFDDFKARYHNLDLLLIDDVQFFGGKEKTQEEFFNTFEALLSRKSHIVMGSDTYPKGLADIHELFEPGDGGKDRSAQRRAAGWRAGRRHGTASSRPGNRSHSTAGARAGRPGCAVASPEIREARTPWGRRASRSLDLFAQLRPDGSGEADAPPISWP